MKSIKLLKTSITTSQPEFKDHKLNYRQELLQLVEISAEGITISQMDSALKIQKALNSVSDEGTLFLEDADHQWLKGQIEKSKFKIIAPELRDFRTAIVEAPEVETPHLKGDKPAEKKTARA